METAKSFRLLEHRFSYYCLDQAHNTFWKSPPAPQAEYKSLYSTMHAVGEIPTTVNLHARKPLPNRLELIRIRIENPKSH
jgi:hypothetical protein